MFVCCTQGRFCVEAHGRVSQKSFKYEIKYLIIFCIRDTINRASTRLFCRKGCIGEPRFIAARD